MAIARISGPLLAANLKRTQSNLAFETDLLYIGALNGRVGVRTDSPNAELNVNGQINTPNVYATRLTGGNLEFSTTGVRSITGDIILDAVEKIKIDRLQTTGTQRIELNDNDQNNAEEKVNNAINLIFSTLVPSLNLDLRLDFMSPKPNSLILRL